MLSAGAAADMGMHQCIDPDESFGMGCQQIHNPKIVEQIFGQKGKERRGGKRKREGMYAGRQKGEYAVRQTVISQIGLAALCLCAS